MEKGRHGAEISSAAAAEEQAQADTAVLPHPALPAKIPGVSVGTGRLRAALPDTSPVSATENGTGFVPVGSWVSQSSRL